MFAGWSGIMQTGVWKYNYPQNSWKLLGNLQNGREHHISVPVKGMECP